MTVYFFSTFFYDCLILQLFVVYLGIVNLKTKDMNPVKKLGLKVGQLVEIRWKDGSGGVYQKLKNGDYYQLDDDDPNAYDWESGTSVTCATLTTAYDCNIDPKDLPIPEPVDSTGWVVINRDLDWPDSEFYLIRGDKIKIREITGSFIEFENGCTLKARIENCQPCLPPTHQETPQKKWEPKEGDLVWAKHDCSSIPEKVKVITDLEGNLAFLDSDLNVIEPDDWEWYKPYTGQDNPEPTLSDEIYDALTHAFAGYEIDKEDMKIGVNNVLRVLETPKPEQKPTWPPVPGQIVYAVESKNHNLKDGQELVYLNTDNTSKDKFKYYCYLVNSGTMWFVDGDIRPTP